MNEDIIGKAMADSTKYKAAEGVINRKVVIVKLSDYLGFPYPKWEVNIYILNGAYKRKCFYRYKSALRYFNNLVNKYNLKMKGES